MHAVLCINAGCWVAASGQLAARCSLQIMHRFLLNNIDAAYLQGVAALLLGSRLHDFGFCWTDAL